MGFSLDEAVSTQLLGGGHGAAPGDIIVSALIHSFASVFSDRGTTAVPPIFSEGHGREPWSRKIDPSNTVGWFTTISPLHVPQARSLDLLATVRSVSNRRRAIPANGMPYFASRFLTPQGRKAFASHAQMEILFNYLGRSQESDARGDALLSAARLTDEEETLVNRQGPKLPRFALFDISADVTADNKVRVAFSYNKKMRRQDEIKWWVAAAQEALRQAVDVLSEEPNSSNVDHAAPVATVTTANQLRSTNFGLDMEEEVQEVYPLAPMQHHMLDARNQHPDRRLYEMELSYHITSSTGSVDIDRLRSAWQKVVDRHAVLRTIFVPVPSSGKAPEYQQVVLGAIRTEVPVGEFADETDIRARIET
jgi:non-ribosomal peptide synthase protein (TIGR01720 family)